MMLMILGNGLLSEVDEATCIGICNGKYIHFSPNKNLRIKQKTYNGDTKSLMVIAANLRCVCLHRPKNAIESTQEEPGDKGGPEIGAEPKHNVEDNSAYQQINIISLQAVMSN